MAKKNARKSGGAAGIAVIDEIAEDMQQESHGDIEAAIAEKPSKSKRVPLQAAGDQVAVSDIKKAAAFANSIGGLDKAIAVLQILKVAREVQ